MARKPDRSTPPEVYSITAAHRSHEAEMRERMVKYAVSMGIRTVCFVLAVVVRHPAPLRWGFVVAALVLPYIAVVIANAGRERTETPTTLIGRVQAPAITPAPVPPPRSSDPH